MRALTVATLLATLLTATPATAAPVGFAPWHDGATAVTYDQAKVPTGSRATALAFRHGRGTLVVLLVRGLLPNRDYGAHVHVRPCGPQPADAGPHFQDVPDPVQPSVDPTFANPTNEVWLDLTTDARGGGLAIASVPWRFRDREASSVVLHDHHTHTDGTAGPRLACLTKHF